MINLIVTVCIVLGAVVCVAISTAVAVAVWRHPGRWHLGQPLPGAGSPQRRPLPSSRELAVISSRREA